MTTPSSKKKCFVLSQIGEDKSPERINADKVLKHIIKKALGGDYEISRADDSVNPGAITPSIVSAILEADLIVADLSGLNANVFYELAIAHGYGKPTVHIQRASESPPFDIKDMRIVRYEITDPDEVEAAQRQLARLANYAEANPGKVETPLTSAKRFEAVEASEDPVAESNVQVIKAINELAADVKRALRYARTSPGATSERRASQSSAEVVSLKTVLGRVVAASRARESDFVGVVSPRTSVPFDDWLMGKLADVIGTSEEGILLDVLYDDELKEREAGIRE